jgi:hypothetical protein
LAEQLNDNGTHRLAELIRLSDQVCEIVLAQHIGP